MKDDLNGITLAIYETEMSKLSERFMITLSHLIEKGIITKSENQDKKIYYQLTNNSE